jgi:hypothetical protein
VQEYIRVGKYDAAIDLAKKVASQEVELSSQGGKNPTNTTNATNPTNE